MTNTELTTDMPVLTVTKTLQPGETQVLCHMLGSVSTVESSDQNSERGSRGVVDSEKVTVSREVVTNFKLTQQCPCKTDGCSATGRTLKGSGHNKGCVCGPCQTGGTTLARQPIRKTAKPGKKLRPGRLKEGTKDWEAERQKAREKSKGLCQAMIALDCSGRGEHLHHRKTRKRGGSDYAINLLDVCNSCHHWIHVVDPLEANVLRMLLHEWEQES